MVGKGPQKAPVAVVGMQIDYDTFYDVFMNTTSRVGFQTLSFLYLDDISNFIFYADLILFSFSVSKVIQNNTAVEGMGIKDILDKIEKCNKIASHAPALT